VRLPIDAEASVEHGTACPECGQTYRLTDGVVVALEPSTSEAVIE
jgi:hypothetical protein